MTMLERMVNRRRLVQSAAAVGLAGMAMPSFRSAAGAQERMLTLSHDKGPWQDLFEQMGALSGEEIGIGLEPTSYPDTTAYQAALLPALTTNDPPDLFTWWSGYRFEELYKQGVVADVSDIWTKAIADGDLPESLAGAFTFDGKQWALPSAVSYWVVFYNKKVFAEQGLTPPTTWEEMLAAAETLKAAGITPFGATQKDRWPSFIWFEELVMRTDPDFYQKLTAGEAKYTDPPAVAAMETWKGLIDAGYFTAFDLDLFTDIPNLFAQGKLAMIPVGSWYYGYGLGDTGMKPGEDYDVFIMPNVNPEARNVVIVETGALAIPAKAPDLEGSKEFGAWWVSPDAQTAWANKLQDMPANAKATSDNPTLGGLVTAVNDGGYELMQRYWEASPVPIVEGAVDYLSQFMLMPDQGQQVLEQIQALADAEWAKRG